MKMKQVSAILLALALVMTGCAGGGDSAAQAQAQATEATAETTEETATEEATPEQTAPEEEATAAEGEAEAAESTTAEGTEATEATEAAAEGTETTEVAAEAAEEPAEPVYPNRTENADGTVDLLIPAEYAEGSTEESLASFMADYSIDSKTDNEDGSFVFHMTAENYENMLSMMREDIDSLLADISASEDVVGVESVEYNDRYTVFVIKKTSPDFGSFEEFYISTYCEMAGQYYGLYLGDPVESVHIEWVDAATGEVLKAVDTGEGDFVTSFYSEEEKALIDTLKSNEDFSQVVVDDEQIKFEFTGISYDGDYFYTWNYHIENKTDKELTFMSSSVSINDILAEPYLYQKVPAGESYDGELNWSISGLADNHITDVTKVDFGLHVQNANDWNDTIYDGRMAIYPYGEDKAISELYTPRENEDQVIADNDLGKAVIIAYESDDYYDLEILPYIENKSDKTLTFTTENFTVGGTPVTSYWSQQVPAGKGAFSSITFLKGGFETAGVTDSSKIAFDLLIKDAEDIFAKPLATEAVEAVPTFG